MTTNIVNATSASVWKRALRFIQEMEEASEYTPAERAVIQLNQRVLELENTIRDLENDTH